MKKFISILLIVVVLVSVFSVTCFANSAEILEQVDDLYPFIDLTWETVSLNFDPDVDPSTASVEDVALYTIDNVFSADTKLSHADSYVFTTTVCGGRSSFIYNSEEYIFSQRGSAYSTSYGTQGVAGGRLSKRMNDDGVVDAGLRCGSVFNLFKSPNLKFASFYDQMDMNDLNNSIIVSFIVPRQFYDNINNGNFDNLYDLTWHFSAEVAHADSEEVFFATETFEVSFGQLYDSGNVSLERDFYGNGADLDCDLYFLSNFIPPGFMFMTLEVPLGDFLYNVSYDHNYGTSEKFYGCFYRNLEFYPTFNIDPDYLAGILFTTAELYGDSPYIQQYFDLLGDGTYFSVVDKERSLPIYSVYSNHKNLDYDVQARYLDLFNDYFNGIVYEPVSLEDFNLVSWIGNTLGGVLDVELIPGISITTILVVVIGLGLLFIILKFFVGG